MMYTNETAVFVYGETTGFGCFCIEKELKTKLMEIDGFYY